MERQFGDGRSNAFLINQKYCLVEKSKTVLGLWYKPRVPVLKFVFKKNSLADRPLAKVPRHKKLTVKSLLEEYNFTFDKYLVLVGVATLFPFLSSAIQIASASQGLEET